MALLCAEVADEKKAEDIAILEVRPILIITSYFVIATGRSRKQLQAVADGIKGRLKAQGVRRLGTEGYEEGRWILLDYGDVIIQLFDPDARAYYSLETVWSDAPRVPFTPKTPAAAAAGVAAAPRSARDEEE